MKTNPRIRLVEEATATSEQKELFASVKQAMGVVPNLVATMAHSPAVAKAYVSFDQILAGGVLPATAREQVVLAVSEANSCNYCVSAHTYLGSKAGLSQEEIANARQGKSNDPRMNAALKFVREIVELRGKIADDSVEKLRVAGLSEAEIAELIANTALSLFTNYFNHIAATSVDFPTAPTLTPCDCN